VGDMWAVVALVATVSVEVPEPLGREFGLKLQVGGTAVVGVMLQVKETVELKPLLAVIVILAVGD
jgi:hypothetical protein